MAGIRTQAAAAPAPEAPGLPAVLGPSYRRAQRPQDLAVVVGIEGYPRLPAASFAERDAAAVSAHLEALGVPARNLVRLSGSEASFTSIKKHVESWLPNNASPGSRVYFYFSGAGGRSVLAEGLRPLVVRMADERPASSRVSVVAAASADEVTGTTKADGHGLFTYYLLDSLNASAADGAATLGSVFRRLKPLVQDEARRQNRSQTPVLFSGAEVPLGGP